MMHLAWVSGNPKAREVAHHWSALSPVGKREVVLEDLCDAVGIKYSDFAAAFAATGFELGVDVSGILKAVAEEPQVLARLADRAMKPGGTRAAERFFEADEVLGARWLNL